MKTLIIDCETTGNTPLEVIELVAMDAEFASNALVVNCRYRPELWPEVDCHKLGAMMYRLFPAEARLLLKSAHEAFGDVWMTKQLLIAILEKLGIGESWETLWQFSETARIPTHFTFGKHKGMAIKDAPSDYKAWFLRQPDIDPYLAIALKA